MPSARALSNNYIQCVTVFILMYYTIKNDSYSALCNSESDLSANNSNSDVNVFELEENKLNYDLNICYVSFIHIYV